MLCRENALFINMRLTACNPVNARKPGARHNSFDTSLKICLVYFRVNTKSKQALSKELVAN